MWKSRKQQHKGDKAEAPVRHPQIANESYKSKAMKAAGRSLRATAGYRLNRFDYSRDDVRTPFLLKVYLLVSHFACSFTVRISRLWFYALCFLFYAEFFLEK